MHIKRCARRQNMYIIASLKHALPPPTQGSIGAKKNLNNHPVVFQKKVFFLFLNVEFYALLGYLFIIKFGKIIQFLHPI